MSPLDRLLEPGRLFQGALVQSLLRERWPTRELHPGQAVGPFRVVRELARGGMGIVYLARRADGEYEQNVAVKWLPCGAQGDERLAQFRRERQILAGLSHPHIARLVDGGRSDDGHLWFAMEHVDGLAVDRHADVCALSWRERVNLLLPIVEAVQFAHGRLVVHRDIKPSNVLVDAEGRAKLLDFGIAACTADDAARAAFTPGYASPEQLAGAPPDVAGDIWQLGRLFEIVLGDARVPADLAAAVAKARAPTPVERYPSASALRADLARVLAYRPVTARPASLAHRVELRVRAHPLVALGGALTLVAFVAVVAGFMLNLARQRDAAERARNVAVAVNRFINDDLLPGTDPVRPGSGDIRVVELLAGALDKVERRLADMPEVAGEINLGLGRSLAGLGRYDAADLALGRAAAQLAATRGTGHDSVLRARLARIQIRIGDRQMKAMEADTLALRHDAVAAIGADAPLVAEIDGQLARAAFLRDDFTLCRTRFDALLTRHESIPRAVLADIYLGLSVCEARLGDAVPALAHARQAHALSALESGADHPLTLETGIAIETALTALGRYDEAVAELRDIVARLGRRYGEEHPTTLTAVHDLGFTLTCAGNPVEGAQWLRRAADDRGRVMGRDHPWFAMSQAVLAMALIGSGDLDAAAGALDAADTALAAHPGGNALARLATLHNRADLALAAGRNADAARLFAQALADAAAIYPPGHQRLTMLELGRGLALSRGTDPDAGRTLVVDALARLGDKPDCRAGRIAQARQVAAVR